MKFIIKIFVVFLTIVKCFQCCTAAEQLSLLKIIALPDISGQIGHMAFDADGNRLFVSASENNRVEIIDLLTSRRIGSITGLSTPQSVLYVNELETVIVSNRGDGTVQFYNNDSLVRFRTINLGNDVDNMQYDPDLRQLFAGYGDGAIAVIDATDGHVIANVKLPGHPGEFVLDRSGKKIFVNIPAAGQVAVIDRVRYVQTAGWKIKNLKSNYPVALDNTSNRLFVVFRDPAMLVVLDSNNGNEVAEIKCIGGAGDIFYDEANKNIYISGGDGGVDLISQVDADHYTFVSRTSTAEGARTSLLVGKRQSLYVAIPRLLYRVAQIREYGIKGYH